MNEFEDYFAAPWPPERGHLCELRDEICIDAYDESEQIMAFSGAFDEWAQLPVHVILSSGSASFVAVEDRGLTLAARIKLPSGSCLSVPLEDVRPEDASPVAFLVASYRLWLGLAPVSPAPEPASDEHVAPKDWEGVKNRLQKLQPDQVLDLVGEIYAASHANRASIHERLGLPGVGPDAVLLAEGKEKVGRYIDPGADEPFQLEAALDIVDRYRAQTLDLHGTVDLLVHCLESGNEASLAYGDLFEEFHGVMAEAADRCGDALEANPELVVAFLPRLQAILAGTPGGGWGPEDVLEELLDRIRGNGQQ